MTNLMMSVKIQSLDFGKGIFSFLQLPGFILMNTIWHALTKYTLYGHLLYMQPSHSPVTTAPPRGYPAHRYKQNK